MNNAKKMAVPADEYLTRQDFLTFWRGRPTAGFVAADAISVIEDTAQRECGLHFEIYEATLLRLLRSKLAGLTGAHRLEFMQALWTRRIRIDDETMNAAAMAERNCLAKIHTAQA